MTTEARRRKSLRICVTGAAGYLGSVLVSRLLASGHQVTAIDCHLFSDPGRLAPSMPGLSSLHIDTRTLDLCHLSDADAVIDLAALSSESAVEAFPDASRQINVAARERTARLALAAGVRQYIFASSCSVYDSTAGFAHEGSVISPATLYSQCNAQLESRLASLASRDFSVTAMRFATLFGPSENMRFDISVNAMVADCLSRGAITIHGSGTQKRPFIHVEDAASAIHAVLQGVHYLPPYSIFNVGNPGLNIDINELAERVAARYRKQTGSSADLHRTASTGNHSYTADCSRLPEAVEWRAMKGLEAGIDELIALIGSGAIERSQRSHRRNWLASTGALDILQSSFDAGHILRGRGNAGAKPNEMGTCETGSSHGTA